jgi:predicted NUDIX family NTP pyrophosphohydrolase
VPKQSAGILLYRWRTAGLEVLLAHPGGPLWAKRDEGAWSIPKGEYEPDEDPLDAACREFREELGSAVPSDAAPIDLGEIRQASGKRVRAWAIEGDLDPGTVTSMPFEMEWPPRSGRMREFPEVDRAAWFRIDDARTRLVRGQVALLDRLVEAARGGDDGG